MSVLKTSPAQALGPLVLMDHAAGSPLYLLQHQGIAAVTIPKAEGDQTLKAEYDQSQSKHSGTRSDRSNREETVWHFCHSVSQLRLRLEVPSEDEVELTSRPPLPLLVGEV